MATWLRTPRESTRELRGVAEKQALQTHEDGSEDAEVCEHLVVELQIPEEVFHTLHGNQGLEAVGILDEGVNVLVELVWRSLHGRLLKRLEDD